MIDSQAQQLFRRSSKTYYVSSIFFPEPYKSDVFALYAYVRTADNYVDTAEPDRVGFDAFVAATWLAWRGEEVMESKAVVDVPTQRIVTNFVALCQRVGIEAAWVEAFLAAMELDFDKKCYQTIAETCHYMYGSAEVIGLMMARFFHLPAASHSTARLLGRSMQFINMIRDAAEDSSSLGRQYLPIDEMPVYGLPRETMLTAALAQEYPEQTAAYLRAQLSRQQRWMLAAQTGFHFLPRSLRIPVQTATDMYIWTAEKIWNNPLVVFQQQIKPSWARVASTAVRRSVTTRFD
jgi:15-cis-phytoene synthase